MSAKEDAFLSWLNEYGTAAVSDWKTAKDKTIECAKRARGEKEAMQRVRTFIECRRKPRV